VGPCGRVDAFEPSAAVARRFARRMGRLSLVPPVVLHRSAVGARHGTATLYEYAHRDGGASSLRPQEHVGAPPHSESRVDLVSVDEHLAAGGGPPALIKIDVEGAEVEVLEGARETLAAARPPVLVVEAAPVTQRAFGRDVQPLLDALHGQGYVARACRRDGLATVETAGDLPPGSRREDLLALRPEHHAALADRLARLARRRSGR
jgi:FkbM family methyltransferase